MSFLGRWFSDALSLALSLAGALVLMQAPALSHEYAAALAQVADAQTRDIGAREATARSYYRLEAASSPPACAAGVNGTIFRRLDGPVVPPWSRGLKRTPARDGAFCGGVVRTGLTPGLAGRRPILHGAEDPAKGSSADAGTPTRNALMVMEMSW